MYKVEVTSKHSIHFYPPWKWSWFGLNKHHPKKQRSTEHHVCEELQFELPTKMAAGFVITFGGALLCLVPGGQGAGLWMIGTGVSLAIDGLVDGERPFYRDSVTGEITPFGNPGP